MVALRIAQIVGEFEPTGGGVARFVNVLSERLAQRGHSIDIFSFGPSTDVSHSKVFQLKRSPMGVLSLWSHLRQGKYDIIHYHSYSSFVPAVCLPGAFLSSALRVFTPHFHAGGHFPAMARVVFDYSVGQVVFRAADLVQVDTLAEFDLIQKMFALRKERIAILPPPLDPVFERGDAPEDRNYGADPFLLLFVGRLDANKGLQDLIEALARIEDKVVKTLELAVVGADQEGNRAQLEALCHQLLKRTSVRFLGALSDEQLAQEYDRSHLFVLPSYYEAFGIAILEAMSRGLPVVATTTGGVPFLVTEGKTGLLVAPGDVEALGRAILDLTGSPELCKALGRAGFLRSKEYAVESIADQQTNLYVTKLSKTKGRLETIKPRRKPA